MFTQKIARALNLPLKNVEKTLGLLAEGATIPFIARYRKEVTGLLDEVEIEAIQKHQKKYEELEKRREAILKSIEEQGKLTPELKRKVEKAETLTELEDIYLPYKRKRRTRATMAIEKGLEPLALDIFNQKNQNAEALAAKFITDEVPTTADALAGARDIIAEKINEDAAAREKIRYNFKKGAIIYSKVSRNKEEEGAKYKDYFDWSEKLDRCPSHRLLAMRRGEEEGILRVRLEPEAERALGDLDRLFLFGHGDSTDHVQMALEDSYKRLLQPSMETEFRNLSKEKADQEAIRVFAENLRQLLLSAPLGERRILGLDPGFRSGCKVVVLDENGNLLNNTAIFPHPPQNENIRAAQVVERLVTQHKIEAIAVGNGTAGRETMDFLGKLKFPHKVEVFNVNEAGASIYSASEAAREEFPTHDVTVRGAVSIGRRLMDPLAELVKIDPKSIGVGQYQHDVNQPMLKESLDRTVESCVNKVGINVNTASKHLLTYVSGLGPVLAQNIVDYRTENGAFKSRTALKKVSRLGAKAFEQAAGFLRIKEAKNPLDNTAVHPERYDLVKKMAKDIGASVTDLVAKKELRQQVKLTNYVSGDVGLPTLQDIMKELEKPGLDPRGEAKPFEFANVHNIEDLYEDMVLPGIITNITAFGAFVDIGIKDSGLVHVSQITNKFIKNPAEVVSLGQHVTVRVISIDMKRRRVALTMKDV